MLRKCWSWKHLYNASDVVELTCGWAVIVLEEVYLARDCEQHVNAHVVQRHWPMRSR